MPTITIDFDHCPQSVIAKDKKFSVPLSTLLQSQLNFGSDGDNERNEALEAVQQSIFNDGESQDDVPDSDVSTFTDGEENPDEFLKLFLRLELCHQYPR